MDVVIHCDQCQAALRVTSEAAGQTARCPKCESLFPVPSLQNMLEETITGWIVHDVEEMLDETDHTLDERLDSDKPVKTQKPKADDDDAEGDPGKRLWNLKPHQNPSDMSGEYNLTVDPPKPKTKKPTSSSDKPHTPESTTSHEARTRGYPTNLRIKDPIPHLVVHRVNTAGVRFAFDSQWLTDTGFRASMPVRCAYTGETDPAKLIARPLLFSDRLLKSGDKVDAITSAHTMRKITDKAPRKIVHTMGTIEHLPEPFNHAMPYYVSTRYARHVLHAQTHDRSSGSITCDILIPDPSVALEWLGRVNGVCGPEYELLERDVSLLHGSAWRKLDEDCRQRLAGWCKLAPDEKLRRYFNDADFGAKDAGLAGLVITDRRLLFRKHHRHGRIDLNREDATIIAKCENNLAHLSVQHKGARNKMLTIRLTDLEELTDLLSEEDLKLMTI